MFFNQFIEIKTSIFKIFEKLSNEAALGLNNIVLWDTFFF